MKTGNIDVRGKLDAVQPSFRAYTASNQAIGNGATTLVHFDTEDWDTEGWFDKDTNHRFTPLRAGKYLIGATLLSQISNDGMSWRVFIFKNGAQELTAWQCSSYTYELSSTVSGIISMNGSTDFVNVYVWHNHGSDVNVLSGRTGTFFWGVRVSYQ